MTKKQLILTIEEDIVEKAKKHIPNISAFVEECMKQYMGIGNNLTPTSKMHELVDTISKCHLELYLMNQRTIHNLQRHQNNRRNTTKKCK